MAWQDIKKPINIKLTIVDAAQDYLIATGRNAEVVYLPLDVFGLLSDDLGGSPDDFEGMQVFKSKGKNIQFGQRGGS
jgi:hypothetical protein